MMESVVSRTQLANRLKLMFARVVDACPTVDMPSTIEGAFREVAEFAQSPEGEEVLRKIDETEAMFEAIWARGDARGGWAARRHGERRAMIYVVTGHPRSGTSMMMAALEAGGLPVVKSEARETFGASHSDENYEVNPGGMWEPSVEQLQSKGFPVDYDGRAVKLVFGFLRLMRPHWIPVENGSEPMYRPGYHVLCMVRHPEEVRQSFASAMELRRPPRQLNKEKLREAWLGYGRIVRESLAALKKRHDVRTLSILNYRRVLQDPAAAFASLDWPIDVDKAAAVVAPAKRRFRLEEMTVGL